MLRYCDLFSEFKPTYEDFIKKSDSNKMDEINELIKRRAGGFTLNELNVLFNFGKIDYLEKVISDFQKVKASFIQDLANKEVKKGFNNCLNAFTQNETIQAIYQTLYQKEQEFKVMKDFLNRFRYMICIQNWIDLGKINRDTIGNNSYYTQFTIQNILQSHPLGAQFLQSFLQWNAQTQNNIDLGNATADQIYLVREWLLEQYTIALKAVIDARNEKNTLELTFIAKFFEANPTCVNNAEMHYKEIQNILNQLADISNGIYPLDLENEYILEKELIYPYMAKRVAQQQDIHIDNDYDKVIQDIRPHFAAWEKKKNTSGYEWNNFTWLNTILNEMRNTILNLVRIFYPDTPEKDIDDNLEQVFLKFKEQKTKLDTLVNSQNQNNQQIINQLTQAKQLNEQLNEKISKMEDSEKALKNAQVEIVKLNKTIENQINEISSLTNRNTQLKNKKSALKTNLSRTQKQSESLMQELNGAKNQLTNANSQMEEKMKQLEMVMKLKIICK